VPDVTSDLDESPAAARVDALGQACPLPVIMLARAIGDVDVGTQVEVLADDPGAKVDIPVWCRMKRHEFVAMDPLEQGWRFVVRRSH
jgi:TusA-related sulfurtransferase